MKRNLRKECPALCLHLTQDCCVLRRLHDAKSLALPQHTQEQCPLKMTQDDDSSLASHTMPEIVILAPFLLLGVGALLRHLTKSLPIPYTVQLLIIGGAFGFFLRNEQWDGALQESVNILGNMNPHLMLHVFLPPLIFESAASMEWHLFAKQKWYIISLAGPGLLIASGLTGLVLHLLLARNADKFADDDTCPNNGWSMSAGLLLGVILSATDPVAVVALLKDLGCKASLSTSIEGESLLNDGTALVMFTILSKIVQGDNSDGWDDYIWTFAKMSCGGVLFGTAFASVAVAWLGLIFNDALSEITITLVAAYLCFFIAEYFLHVSGVLAVVCLGLYFGHKGRTSVSPEVAHFLEEFWELLAFFGNTLVFVVGGAVVGYKMPLVKLADYGRLGIMYGACTGIRAIVVFAIYGIFKLCGSSLDWKSQIVTVWGGIRGAVGLSLAMMVFDSSSICQPIRDEVMFYTAGIVVLTVCVNSVSLPWLLKMLLMDAVAPSRQLVHDQAMIKLAKAGAKQELNLRADHVFDACIWTEAQRYYFQVPDKMELPGQDRRLRRRRSSNTSEDEDMASNVLDAKEARRRVLMITKKSYWRQFQDGLLSRSSVKYLLHHTDNAFDDGCTLREWDTFAQNVKLTSTFHKQEGIKDLAKLSKSQLRRRKILACLDSIPAIFCVLALVALSCSAPLFPDTTPFHVLEHATTAIFFVELCLRLYCAGNWHSFAVDGYLMMDAFVICIDIALLGAGDILGGASRYVVAGRIIRFLKLLRLLRLGRVLRLMRKAKVAAVDERENLLWGKQGSLVKRYQRRIIYAELLHGYQIASGFKIAREEALAALRHIDATSHDLSEIRSSIEQDIRDVRTSLLDMQRLYSEIASSITTSVAARTVLNRQRRTLEDLHTEGLLDQTEYMRIRGSVEFQMKRLTHTPPLVVMPKKKDLLSQIPWLQCATDDALSNITAAFDEAVFKTDDVLVAQGEVDDRVHILARGTVKVFFEKPSGERVVIDEIGMGSVFGEISFLLNYRRGASIVASSSGLIFTIDGATLRQFIKENPELEMRLWKTCGRRLAENLLSVHLEDRGVSRSEVRDAVHEMRVHHIYPDGITTAWFKPNSGHIVLLRGRASFTCETSGRTEIVEAPRVLEPPPNCINNGIFEVEFSTDAKFMCHPQTKGTQIGSSSSIVSGGSGSITPMSSAGALVPSNPLQDGKDSGHGRTTNNIRRPSILELELKSSRAHSSRFSTGASTTKGRTKPKVRFRAGPGPGQGGETNSATRSGNDVAPGEGGYLRSPDRGSEHESQSESTADPTSLV